MKRQLTLLILTAVSTIAQLSTQIAFSQIGWTSQSSGVSISLNSVKAVSKNIAWIACNSGIVLKTTNGGINWVTVGGGTIGTADVYNIEALDANTAFVTTTPAATNIYRTTNGGTTWTRVYTDTSGFINAIHMFNSANGIAVGDPVATKWVILRTTNGGTIWSRISTEPLQQAGDLGTNNGLCVIDPNHIWFTSIAGGRIYRSTNGGLTWNTSTTPFAVTRSIWFNSIQDGVVTGSNAIARSTDGGATWSASPLPGTGSPYACGGISGTPGFFCVRGPNIYRSTNRGTTWVVSYADSGIYNALNFIRFTANSPLADSTAGWACNSTGRIGKYLNTVTVVRDNGSQDIPRAFVLVQNYPNPFNPKTNISFQIPTENHVTLRVFDVLGREVTTLADESLMPGKYSVAFDASDLAGGVYIYRLHAGNFMAAKRMMLVK